MIALPPGFGGRELLAWRLDKQRHADTWNSGVGAHLEGGRWNSPGTSAVYASLDPAAAILEVAAHISFALLDTTPNVLTAFEILDRESIHVVQPEDVPNQAWLRPSKPSMGQQRFGDAILREYGALIVPSVVSRHSWNLVFDAEHFDSRFRFKFQEPLELDTRLSPPFP